jgi:hypothetical protein
MKQNPSEDELLRRYLLEELPQEEADELDRRLLVDDELFVLAEAVEADLLAAAARGELAPAERERVLKRLASSPQGRERLALAWALNRAADEEHRKADVVQFPLPTRRSWKPALWTAMAASLLAAVIGISVLKDDHNESPIEPIPAPSLAGPLEPLGRTALQLVFLPGNRDAGEAETAHERLHLTPDVDIVDLKLDVTEFYGLKSFKVALRNKEHNTIWVKSGLEARKVDGDSALVLEVPAAKLAVAGRYEVRIEGIKESGELEELPLQEFEVVTNGNP